jgi:hypothetical protein
MQPHNNYEQLFLALRNLFCRTHRVREDKVPPFVYDSGREAVAQFLGERTPDHSIEQKDDPFLLVFVDSKLHRLRFSDEDEGGLEVQYLGQLLGGEYSEWYSWGGVRFCFQHPNLGAKPLELSGSVQRYSDLRDLLRGWAETPIALVSERGD